ncbi:MAG: hypothetical protein ABJA60_11250 [Nitrosospira sp.]
MGKLRCPDEYDFCALEQVQEILFQLTELCPESLPYADFDDID